MNKSENPNIINRENHTLHQHIWGYGQEDCFSSLVLMIPEDNLTLTLLANNNLMSDPPRLINGDITYSLFVLSFLKHYVFDLPHHFTKEDWANPETLDFALASNEFSSFYRQEILAHALTASFMSAGYPEELERCVQLSRIAFKHFPNFTEYGNLSLMRSLSVLANSHPEEFGVFLETLGLSLIEEYPYNPYANIYLAYYYQTLNQEDEALKHFQQIAGAPNFRPFSYTIEALDFLGKYYNEKDPVLAKRYFQRIVDIGWNMNGIVDNAKRRVGRVKHIGRGVQHFAALKSKGERKSPFDIVIGLTTYVRPSNIKEKLKNVVHPIARKIEFIDSV